MKAHSVGMYRNTIDLILAEALLLKQQYLILIIGLIRQSLIRLWNL